MTTDQSQPILAARAGYVVFVNTCDLDWNLDRESFADNLDEVRAYGAEWYPDETYTICPATLLVRRPVETHRPKEASYE